jgi:GAF domain-containing protein
MDGVVPMDSKKTISTEAAFHRFTELVAHAGLRPALAYLLSLTDYRYIAIFRGHGDMATAAVYYDRDNPEILRVDEVPASATYCALANDAKAVFTTANALEDARLTSHPARQTVQSYWGLPVMTPEGQILGTLCHYDDVPRDPSQVDLELMIEVASTLEQKGLVPPYPLAQTRQPA